ncbi:MAG: PBS lyase [Deltaproteobacteria bacterium]|nr:PBS lyase [Deltaproteobacteria bacterium]
MTTPYVPPVHQLLALGEAKRQDVEHWHDYRSLGFDVEHVPELIRMATDPGLHGADGDSPEVWAPLHAWRALGQLRAVEAVRPLLYLMAELEHDDWLLEEVPDIGGLVGPQAIPVLSEFLGESERDRYARVAAGHGLERIGTLWPEARGTCVAALTAQLERFAEDDSTLNGFLIGYLVDLDAKDALPTIGRAFAADCVDISIGGDLEDVEIELGVRAHRDTPPKMPPWMKSMRRAVSRVIQQKDREAAARARRKKKAAKAARRKNRR